MIIEVRPKQLEGILALRVYIVIFSLLFILITVRDIKAELKWKEIAEKSQVGETLIMLPEYKKLYSILSSNPFFLYNYAAELNIAEDYQKSIYILKECTKIFNDYDLQMLLATNYFKIGKVNRAIKIYDHASKMIPCRFQPLYQLMMIHQVIGKRNMVLKYAQDIVNKKVKIPSSKVSYIRRAAINVVNEFTKDQG